MCGIAGFVGSYSEANLVAMSAAIRHRGPDDRGVFLDAPAGVGLAHTRLSIIDLSPAGHQPMTDASGRFTIVFNGEIYNYRCLRSELESGGARFRSHSDTEVLLEAFAREGPKVLQRLNGIFALAIWDHQEGQLLVARDAMGVKPLYWTVGKKGFAFASELKALCTVLSRFTLDPEAVHRYMTYLWCPGDGTPLKEVRKLDPGEAAFVGRDSLPRRWKWYELPARRTSLPIVNRVDAAGRVERSLQRAVERQLVSDVPVGAFLSGGLDSSAIVAFAAQRYPAIRCFSIDLTGGGEAGFADDLPYARRVAAHLKVQLDVVSVSAAHMAEKFAGMVGQLDEPLGDPAPLNVLFISELARSQGIKVLLSGAGGDDLFSGYRRHVALRHQWLWNWMPAAPRQRLAARAEDIRCSTPFRRRMQRVLSNIGGSRDQQLVGYFRWASESRIRALYSPDFAAALLDSRADAVMSDFLDGMSVDIASLERMLALEQRYFLADHNLAYTDRMSMAAGVEVRVPFLDLELVELAATIPGDLKLRGNETKWILKQAMEQYLPREVIYRSKTGFGAPVRRWLRNELKPLVYDLLGEQSLRRRGIFLPAAVNDLIQKDDAGDLDGAYTILTMMSVELWCRRYLDAR